MKFGKVLALILIIIMLLGASVMVAGCSVEDMKQQNAELKNQIDILTDRLNKLERELKKGEFYTLEQSYNLGLITKEDLQTVANYHNSYKDCDKALLDSVATYVKETAAYDMRNDADKPVAEACADGFTIIRYYGEYNGCYVVILENQYFAHIAVDRDIWQEIDGVRIHYTNWFEIVVWTRSK